MDFLKRKHFKRSTAIPSFGMVVLLFAGTACFASPVFAQKELDDFDVAAFMQKDGESQALEDGVTSTNHSYKELRNNFIRVGLIQEEGLSAPVTQERFEPENSTEGFYEDLILAVLAGQDRLSAGIFAVQRDDRYYVPVGVLADLLGFRLDVEENGRYVSGFSISEERSFSIDLNKNEVSYKGRATSVSPQAFLAPDIADDDVYVLVEVLNEIWPVDMQVNLSGLVLKISPDEKLPLQQMLERKKKQELLLRQREKQERVDIDQLPFVARPYQFISKPILDVQAATGYNARQDSAEHSLNIGGVNDLGFASADYAIAFSHRNRAYNKPESLRLRFRRQNIHEGALPFGLEDVQWGDVRLQNRDLIASGLRGRGAVFSTREYDFANEFDVISIDGVGPAGWETELYINDQLIDFGVVDGQGQYLFEDVSIGYGNNRLRVVLYGPQGQIRERVENYFFQSSMVKAGGNMFSGGIIDSQSDLIPIEERANSRPEGLAANLYAARGLTDRLTVFATANSLHDNDDATRDFVSRQYLSVGAIGTYKDTLAQAEIYNQVGAGQAIDLRTLSDFKGFKINTKTGFYSDFESPQASNGEQAKDFTFEFDIRRTFATFLGTLGLEFGTDYEKRKNDTSIMAYDTRQSLAIPGTRITHQTRTNLSDGSHGSTTGRLSSTTRMNKWRLRNTYGYSLFPDVKNSNFQSELRYGTNRDFSQAISAGYNFDTKEKTLGYQVAKDFGRYLGSFDTSWSSDYGVGFMVRASTSLGPYGSQGQYGLQSDPLRTVGPISSFVYNDRDYDGTFSEGDEPVPNTKIKVGSRTTRDETDETGYLTEINPAANGRTSVSVASESIDDPYLISAVPGYGIYTRPGVMHNLEFPLIETGAIDGTLRWAHDSKPISGLKLQLMDGDADIIKESTTAIDGYFTFERVPPGSYTIRANPETGVNIPFTYVDITPDELFLFGTDIDAIDLNKQNDSDLEIAVTNEGLLNVDNIISIAKGFKDKVSMKAKAAPAKVEASQASANAAQKVASGNKGQGPVSVNAVRIGSHPDKMRVVLDLSGPTSYDINYDPSSNSIFVELPFANWSAKKIWDGDASAIIQSYRIEEINGNTRMIMSVQEGAGVGASGLLNASGDKKDRLYIDVERK